MPIELARWIVAILFTYLGVGVVFAPIFVLFGVHRIDPGAHGSTWGFRLMIVPGVVLLWPLLLRRVRLGQPPPDERNAHRRAARGARG
jgi:hypothetical protein